ncbi:MAG TPA: L,D-transpeptidase family protein [Fimbriimonadaceae bacterium]|nr:L,D-transpeptidase family protein [Fimbriimonadaceae bacterium]
MRAFALPAAALAFLIAGCHRSHPPALTAAPPGSGDSRPIKAVCSSLGIPYPPRSIFLRAFKAEGELELWGMSKSGPMKLIRIYPIAAESGGPGPKRREGDDQVPEGVYRVSELNPHSHFDLSLKVDYPNKADRILGAPHPGGDIFIHGNHVSAGCLAMTDPKIEEIYPIAAAAREPIPVHIFPCRMEGDGYRALRRQYPALVGFWDQLEPIYRAFEVTRRVPKVEVTNGGAYRLAESP